MIRFGDMSRKISQSDLDWFAARLSIAVYDANRITPEMSVKELKDALPDIMGVESLTVSYACNGNQIIHIGDKSVEVGPMASNEEIRLALQNPFVRTENTKITMASPLQGVGQKLSLLKHNAEAHAKKISEKVDSLSTRMDVATEKSLQALDGQEKDVVDVENFVADIEKATNV